MGDVEVNHVGLQGREAINRKCKQVATLVTTEEHRLITQYALSKGTTTQDLIGEAVEPLLQKIRLETAI